MQYAQFCVKINDRNLPVEGAEIWLAKTAGKHQTN